MPFSRKAFCHAAPSTSASGRLCTGSSTAPHFVQIEPHPINRFLQVHILLLLMLQFDVDLLGDSEIVLQLCNEFIICSLLTAPFLSFQGMHGSCVVVVLDLVVSAAQGDSITFRLVTLFLVLFLETLVRDAGIVKIPLKFGNLGFESTDLGGVLSLKSMLAYVLCKMTQDKPL